MDGILGYVRGSERMGGKGLWKVWRRFSTLTAYCCSLHLCLSVVVSCSWCPEGPPSPQVVGVVDWMPDSSSCPILDFSCESLLVSNDKGYSVCYSFLSIIVFVFINLVCV